jgi:hypothetical protein
MFMLRGLKLRVPENCISTNTLPEVVSHDGVAMGGVGSVIAFIEHLQIVTISTYSAIANSYFTLHTLHRSH